MGHQGGIARFTGSLGELTFYFDDDRESVRWKSKWKKKKWLARKEMWRQHNSSRLFGSASIIAGNLWVGMPAGLRRLADGSGYGRLVGRCNSLIGDDGQLWDADLLKGLELNEDALAPSVRFSVGNSVSGNSLSLGSGPECEAGTAVPYRLEGLDQLNQELDLALGEAAGTKPATFLVAHGLNRFGLGMKGLKLTAEEAQVKTAFRDGGARDQGQGAGKSLSLSSGPECEKAHGASRRFRVWVNAVKVAETLWNSAQKRFYLDTGHGVGGVGYVTDWEQNFPDSLNLRNPFEGEKLEFDGEYVVYCALEVSEKRGRHWVRLPYCCRFRVVDVVGVENGMLVVEKVAAGGEEGLRCGKQGSVSVDAVWKKERSLLALSEPSPLRSSLRVEAAGREVLIEIKRHFVPCLDIMGRDPSELSPLQSSVGMWLSRAWSVSGMPQLGTGIAWSLFSKAFAMAEAIACANSGLWPPFARSVFSKAFAMAEAIRAGP